MRTLWWAGRGDSIRLSPICREFAAGLPLLGAYGYIYMKGYAISRMYRDARVMRIYAGTTEIMKVVIARSL